MRCPHRSTRALWCRSKPGHSRTRGRRQFARSGGTNRRTTPNPGLLENWRHTIWLFLAFAYESVASWLKITKHHRFPHGPTSIFAVALALLMAASITYRSPFSGDRVVPGAVAAAFVLMAVRMAHHTRLAMLVVYAAESFMVLIAAATCLVVLVHSFKTVREQ